MQDTSDVSFSEESRIFDEFGHIASVFIKFPNLVVEFDTFLSVFFLGPGIPPPNPYRSFHTSDEVSQAILLALTAFLVGV